MASETLKIYRSKIDELDVGILRLLSERYKLIKQIAEYKAKENIPMMQNDRVDEVMSKCIKSGKKLGLSETFIQEIFTLIISNSCEEEDKIIDKILNLKEEK